MKLKFKTFEGGGLEVDMITPSSERMHMSDLAALQRETGWRMDYIAELGQLEIPAIALAIYMSLRTVGRKITYAKAEELLDDIEFVEEPGDTAEPEPDPTKAPAESGEGSEPTP